MYVHKLEDHSITNTFSMSSKPYACCQKWSVVLLCMYTNLKIIRYKLHSRCPPNPMPAVKNGVSCFYVCTQTWRSFDNKCVLDVLQTLCLLSKMECRAFMYVHKLEDHSIQIAFSMSSKPYACCQKWSVVLLKTLPIQPFESEKNTKNPPDTTLRKWEEY